MYIKFGFYFIDRGNGKIKDEALIAILISLEFGNYKGTAEDPFYEAGISAISNQYHGTRFMYPSANPDCHGACTLAEQISWLYDMEVTFYEPVISTDFGVFEIDAAKIIQQPFGQYWHWGNGNDGDTLKGDFQLKKFTPNDKYDDFYVYGFNN